MMYYQSGIQIDKSNKVIKVTKVPLMYSIYSGKNLFCASRVFINLFFLRNSLAL
jgi:hypothetical protein